MAAALEEFISGYNSSVQQLVRETRRVILDAFPNAVEVVDPPSKIVAYGFGTRYKDLICAIAPFQAYVNLMFSQGTQLPDPDHLLQGTGKRARHLRITTVEEANRMETRRMIEAALQIMETQTLT